MLSKNISLFYLGYWASMTQTEVVGGDTQYGVGAQCDIIIYEVQFFVNIIQKAIMSAFKIRR